MSFFNNTASQTINVCLTVVFKNYIDELTTLTPLESREKIIVGKAPERKTLTNEDRFTKFASFSTFNSSRYTVSFNNGLVSCS